MNLENLSNLENQIRSNWTHIEFKKKDGSIRQMVCTTNLALIPEQFHPKPQVREQQEENVAFAVEKPIEEDKMYKVFEKDNGWRSFRQSQLVIND